MLVTQSLATTMKTRESHIRALLESLSADLASSSRYAYLTEALSSVPLDTLSTLIASGMLKLNPLLVSACCVCGARAESFHGRPATCSGACRQARASSTMAKTNREWASNRMIVRNPMRNPEARAKMSASLRRIGHRPPIQGGNGRGLTVPQAALLDLLAPHGFVPELVVKTGYRRGSGLPTKYFLDLANEPARVCVEVDGSSHCNPKTREKDERKGAFLIESGWTLYRFWNQEVMADTEACARTVLSTISR